MKKLIIIAILLTGCASNLDRIQALERHQEIQDRKIETLAVCSNGKCHDVQDLLKGWDDVEECQRLCDEGIKKLRPWWRR